MVLDRLKHRLNINTFKRGPISSTFDPLCVQCRKAFSCHQGAGWIFFLVPPRSLGLYPVGLEEADEEKLSHPVTHVVCQNRNAGLQRLLSDNLPSHNTCTYVVDGFLLA